jgi:excisionase family DNA binding protein
MGSTSRRTQTTPESSPKLLRINEAAHDLAVSQRTIWRLIAAGELEAVNIGRAVRVTRASLDAFCERQR